MRIPMLAVAALALLPATAPAAVLDPGFGNRGVVSPVPASGVTTPTLNAVAIDSSRRLLVAGTDNAVPQTSYVTRLRTDGTADPSFGGDGTVVIKLFAQSVAALPDGDTLVGGLGGIARLTPDGSLDAGFGDAGYLTSGREIVRDFAVAPGGAVDVLAGARVLRLTPAGKPDPKFGTDGFATPKLPSGDSPLAIAHAPSGGVAVAGRFNAVRLTKAGKADKRFGRVSLGLSGNSKNVDLAVDRSDRTLLAGARPVGNTFRAVVGRFTPRGRLDKRYGKKGLATVAERTLPTGIVTSASGAATLPAAWGALGYAAAIRLTPKGRLDPAFGEKGLALAPEDPPFDARMAATAGPDRIGFAGFMGRSIAAGLLSRNPG